MFYYVMWWYSYAQLSMMQNIYKQEKIQNYQNFYLKGLG
jgi:hypothetical protein